MRDRHIYADGRNTKRATRDGKYTDLISFAKPEKSTTSKSTSESAIAVIKKANKHENFWNDYPRNTKELNNIPGQEISLDIPTTKEVNIRLKVG